MIPFFASILGLFRPKPPAPRSRTRAVLTAEELRVDYGDGKIEVMPRDRICEIAVRTTATGPFLEDVFWSVSDGTETLHIPQGSPDFAVLLEEFERWPGFSSKPFVEAMSCTDDRLFVCWSKPVVEQGRGGG